MAKVLSISSQVVSGHVGNSSSAFVMQRMGHEVLPLPTILLSNRPGYRAIAGEPVAPAKLDALLEASLANGRLADLDAVVTGYLPTPEHVMLCATWIDRIKALNPRTLYLCDPIIGDAPGGIYIDALAARAVRENLVPLADGMTPNAFELGWLTGRTVSNVTEAIAAARSLGRSWVIVTSAPAAAGLLANILVTKDEMAATASPVRTVEAHGTGDFFASVFLSHKLNERCPVEALRAATAAIDHVVEASIGLSELPLIATQDAWSRPDPRLAPLFRLSDQPATRWRS